LHHGSLFALAGAVLVLNPWKLSERFGSPPAGVSEISFSLGSGKNCHASVE
jgi:hypothetical protein